MGIVASWLRRWRPQWRAFRPRLVRRTLVHCPRTGALVEIDLLMRRTGSPDVVLRCTAHPECPPSCDQACRALAEAIDPAGTLIICPPGSGPPEEVD
jgi:hypothetical protein